eukprot:UN13475
MNPTVTAVFQAFTPINGALLGALAGAEKLTCTKLLGALLTGGGTILFGISNLHGKFNLSVVIGYVLLFVECVFNAGSCVFMKKMTKTFTPITTIAWANVICVFICGGALAIDYIFELEENIGVMNDKLLLGLTYAICGVTP